MSGREFTRDGLVTLTWPSPKIALVTLNDPSHRNAMSAAMADSFSTTIGILREVGDLRAVVLAGEGPVFSAGGDLGMLEDFGRRTRYGGFDATQEMLDYYSKYLSIRYARVPSIAAIEGAAIGAALCLAIACDLTVVAEDAKLGMTFARLGLHPGMGGSRLLIDRAGRQRATELLYTARVINGREAAEYGIALEATPHGQALARALEIANQIASAAPSVVNQLKQTLGHPHDVDESLVLEARSQAVNYRSKDFQEGIKAIRDRRIPKFSIEPR